MENKQNSRNKAENKRQKHEWELESALFAELNEYFHFTLDACARNAKVAKCARFFDKKANGLVQSWAGETVYCCPPTGAQEFFDWTAKAKFEAECNGVTSVLVLPVSTDTIWFQDNVETSNTMILFCKRRLKFINTAVPSYQNGNLPDERGHQQDSPRSSMVVVFLPNGMPKIPFKKGPRNDGKIIGTFLG